MSKRKRDDFSKSTVLQIAKRAGWLCSFPSCSVPTVGATSDGESEINIGTAAHICAAAPGGPRYDESMTREERSSAKNGIWMCRDHGKAIDSNDPIFTVELLREWKQKAEIESYRRVIRNSDIYRPDCLADEHLHQLFRGAAKQDLNVFQHSPKWPSTPVKLSVDVDGLDELLTTNDLAVVVSSLDDLILIAPPGMGKTSALFQIADFMLEKNVGVPLIVLLGDWAAESDSILDSVLKRSAFRDIPDESLPNIVSRSDVVLMLDGWNELDAESRKRARVQINKLKAELPELCLLVSTRKQQLDVPFQGKHVNLMPLTEKQQNEIAFFISGENGLEIVDRACRTSGVRDLVAIPLYLVALLSLPLNEEFPKTKEEVLRYFVALHERDPQHVEELHAIAVGFQTNFLVDLAVFATIEVNTSIIDEDARNVVFHTEKRLEDSGQITTKPQPMAVLDVLVNHHMLMRVGDQESVFFQHQQFQEWYASHFVENQIIDSIYDTEKCAELKEKIFNNPEWEEAILFTIDRLALGQEEHRTICGKTILEMLDVDPIFASEMIYRSTDEVWSQISQEVLQFVDSWHTHGKIDRAFRFMLTSGRPEFCDSIWPLITHDNDQTSLNALRSCKEFRPSVLGEDATRKILALPTETKLTLLREIAYSGGVDGFDLVCDVAIDDVDPNLQVSVIEALVFRRADRYIELILKNAPDETFDLVVRKDLVDEISDDQVKHSIALAKDRYDSTERSVLDRLDYICFTQDDRGQSEDLVGIIRSIEIDHNNDRISSLIYRAYDRYPDKVIEGLVARLFDGNHMFFGADDLLASEKLNIEADEVLQLALSMDPKLDMEADTAASVLGPQATGHLFDVFYETHVQVNDESVGNRKELDDRYQTLKNRIAHVPTKSLIEAIVERSEYGDNEQIAHIAFVLSYHVTGNSRRHNLFDTNDIDKICNLIILWGDRILGSGTSKRWQVAQLARLVVHSPDVRLLPVLNKMLNDNLQRYHGYRKEAEASMWRDGDAVAEARAPMMDEYRSAFAAIDNNETRELMCEYLSDQYFGHYAAGVITKQWIDKNEPQHNEASYRDIDFSRIAENRSKRISNPDSSCDEADAIFAVIDNLVADKARDDEKKLASHLGIQAVRLPHGQRQDTINKLITITPLYMRPRLFLNLIHSGYEVSSQFIADGITELLEQAEEKPWLITEGDAYKLREWLRLLPFTTHPEVILEIGRELPESIREPKLFEELFWCLTETPSEDGAAILFRLAEADNRFFSSYHWWKSAINLDTASAAQYLIDIIGYEKINFRKIDEYYLIRELGVLLGKYPEVRHYVYCLLKEWDVSSSFELLARVVSENPDTDGLLLLIEIANKEQGAYFGWNTIEKVVTNHVPDENWSGTYNIVPVPAVILRKKLLEISTDGGTEDIAARCLRAIDDIRDEYGYPVSEPRHPDLTSGKKWPILPTGNNVVPV